MLVVGDLQFSDQQRTIKMEIKQRGSNFFYDRQHGLCLVGRCGRRGEASWDVRVGHAHGVVPPHGPLLLRFAHGWDVAWTSIVEERYSLDTHSLLVGNPHQPLNLKLVVGQGLR